MMSAGSTASDEAASRGGDAGGAAPAAVTTASYRLGVPPEPPPRLVEASSVAPAKSQPSYAAFDAIRYTLWALLYLKLSLSPTATLYELATAGMADQNMGPEPIATVLVAAASVPGDESRDGGEPSATLGTSSRVMPRVEESEVCTAAAVAAAGTAMVAVMITLSS